jgi:hypothetical protein
VELTAPKCPPWQARFDNHIGREAGRRPSKGKAIRNDFIGFGRGFFLSHTNVTYGSVDVLVFLSYVIYIIDAGIAQSV